MTRTTAVNPKKKKVRYGVIGLGHIAQAAMIPAFRHAKSNSDLTAFISDDPVKLKKLARKYGVEHVYAYDDYETCLTSGNIDAIYIATPNHTHRALMERAAASGIHVLCEKPLALNEAGCQSMIHAAQENRVKLMTAYRLHFETANLKAIDMARSGKLGDLKYFSSVFSMQVKDRDNIRLGPVQKGGGPLYDIGIYCINAARNLFRAEPIEVCALASSTGDSRFAEADEMISATLRFPEGQLATFTISFGAADAATFDIVGSTARLRLDNAYEYATSHTMQIFKNDKVTKREFAKKDQFAPELVYFSDCILNSKQIEPSGLEGLADVRVIEAIQKSMDTRQAVPLSKFSSPRKTRWPGSHQKIERPALARVPHTVHATAPGGS